MSKAVLVMEMPEGCLDCDFHNYHFCNVTGRNIDKNLYDIMEDNKPDWCPLKKLPEEIHSEFYMYEYAYGYDDGWNNCLKKILED